MRIKKSMAVALAGVMTAGVVAPVVANAAEVVRPADNDAKFKELDLAGKLNMKFSNASENANLANENVYPKGTIIYTIDGDDTAYSIVKDTEISANHEVSVKQFEGVVKGLKHGQVLRLQLNPHAYKVNADGTIVNKVQAVNPKYTETVKKDLIYTLEAAINEGRQVWKETDPNQHHNLRSSVTLEEIISDNKVSARVKLTTTDKYGKDVDVYNKVITTGDSQIDFTKPIVNVETKALEGFQTKTSGFETVPARDEHVIFSNSNFSTNDVSKYFNGKELTEDAHELISKSMLVVEGADQQTRTTIVENGSFLLTEPYINNSLVQTVKDENGKVLHYQLKMYVRNLELAKTSIVDGDLTEIVITSDSQNKLIELLVQMSKYSNPKFTMIGSDDTTRFETAIEVSKARFENNTADTVVLTGANAIVDGLAAGPLASATGAPILLTNKDAIDTKTMEEINRVFGTVAGKTVYLIGDEEIISKDIEKVLDAKKINVVRLGGETRIETSLAIANELSKLGLADNEAFVVGYAGEADAMSVAPVASKVDNGKVSPIIVSGQNGLTKDAKDFIAANTNKTKNGEAIVLGDTGVVPSTTQTELIDILGKNNVERLQGEDRQDTNAAVINKYYNIVDNNRPEKVFVAKDGRNTTGATDTDKRIGQLIDALVAAPWAAAEGAPIVLATENLTASQEKVLASNIYIKDAGANPDKLVQVGSGVKTSVMNKIVNALRK